MKSIFFPAKYFLLLSCSANNMCKQIQQSVLFSFSLKDKLLLPLSSVNMTGKTQQADSFFSITLLLVD